MHLQRTPFQQRPLLSCSFLPFDVYSVSLQTENHWRLKELYYADQIPHLIILITNAQKMVIGVSKSKRLTKNTFRQESASICPYEFCMKSRMPEMPQLTAHCLWHSFDLSLFLPLHHLTASTNLVDHSALSIISIRVITRNQDLQSRNVFERQQKKKKAYRFPFVVPFLIARRVAVQERCSHSNSRQYRRSSHTAYYHGKRHRCLELLPFLLYLFDQAPILARKTSYLQISITMP